MEKSEIIQAINEIRKEIGLKPYPLEELEAKSIEELRELYHQYFLLRENYRKRIKEEKKFKLNFKTALLIGIPILIFISFVVFSLVSGPKAVNPSLLPPLKPEGVLDNKTGELIQSINFSLKFSFKGPDENYILVIENNGRGNVTFQKILVDEEAVNFEIFSGEYPLLPQSSVYLKISKKCDNSTHKIKIISEKRSTEETLPAC
jgi:hypothetical protein